MAKRFTQAQKDTIGEMLTQWGKMMYKRTPLEKGKDTIDVKAMHKMEETQALIEALKIIGVKSSSQLMEMGFVAAGMLIRFK